MIILSDENLKNMFFNLTVSNYCFLPRQNYPQNEEISIGYSQMFSAIDSSMNGTWNTYL